MDADIANRLTAYEDMMSAGWLWLHPDFVMVCEPPVILNRENPNDRVRRLHSLDGPAVAWRDGTALWFVHGVQVSQEVVESPESLTPERIRSERNAEVRRVMIDRFGAARYLRAIDAKLLSEDSDQFGFRRRLLSAALPDDEPLVMLEVVNSSPEPIDYVPEDGAAGVWVGKRWHKVYMLRVSPECRTARQAWNWMNHLPLDADCNPLVET